MPLISADFRLGSDRNIYSWFSPRLGNTVDFPPPSVRLYALFCRETWRKAVSQFNTVVWRIWTSRLNKCALFVAYFKLNTMKNQGARNSIGGFLLITITGRKIHLLSTHIRILSICSCAGKRRNNPLCIGFLHANEVSRVISDK